jgi:hypothetical protein
MSKIEVKVEVVLPFSGAMTAAFASTTLGSIGLVGGFGGISLSMGTMTGVGLIIGSAIYGGFQTLQTGDKIGYSALGLGMVGGVGLYNTIGGVGLGIGGTAFSLGMGTMALSGGVLGLGLYGLSQILNNNYSVSNYYANSFFLEKITQEYQEQRFWSNLEIEEEFNQLQEKLKDRIDYKKLEEKRTIKKEYLSLKTQRKILLQQLKKTYFTSAKFRLLKEIDELEKKLAKLEKENYYE